MDFRDMVLEVSYWLVTHPIEQVFLVMALAATILLLARGFVNAIDGPDQNDKHKHRIIRTKDEGALDFREPMPVDPRPEGARIFNPMLHPRIELAPAEILFGHDSELDWSAPKVNMEPMRSPPEPVAKPKRIRKPKAKLDSVSQNDTNVVPLKPRRPRKPLNYN